MELSIEEFKDISQSELQNLTTKELLEAIDMVEKHVQEETGVIDVDKVFEVDSELGDRLGVTHDVLRGRLHVPSNYWKQEIDNQIEQNKEKSTDNEESIEKLKDHTHDKQGKTVYRFQ